MSLPESLMCVHGKFQVSKSKENFSQVLRGGGGGDIFSLTFPWEGVASWTNFLG